MKTIILDETLLERAIEAASQPTHDEVTIDLGDYVHHLVDSDASEDEIFELLSVIYSIGLAFVDLGFKIDPCHEDSRQDSGDQLDLNEQ